VRASATFQTNHLGTPGFALRQSYPLIGGSHIAKRSDEEVEQPSPAPAFFGSGIPRFLSVNSPPRTTAQPFAWARKSKKKLWSEAKRLEREGVEPATSTLAKRIGIPATAGTNR
jgi:hypothetical protein